MTKETTTTKYVIFDTDMGCDDAWALQMILKAEKHYKNVKVLAITAVNGNTTVENVVKNTYRILDGLDRTDVSNFPTNSWKKNLFQVNLTMFLQIPIYKGATEALIPNPEMKVGSFHGENGFADIDFWDLNIYPSDINRIVQQQHAIEIIRDLVLEVCSSKQFFCRFEIFIITLEFLSTHIKYHLFVLGH